MWLESGGTDPTERLLLALGSANALRAQGGGDLVLAFAAADDLSTAQWQQVLGRAGILALPLVGNGAARQASGLAQQPCAGVGSAGDSGGRR